MQDCSLNLPRARARLSARVAAQCSRGGPRSGGCRARSAHAPALHYDGVASLLGSSAAKQPGASRTVARAEPHARTKQPLNLQVDLLFLWCVVGSAYGCKTTTQRTIRRRTGAWPQGWPAPVRAWPHSPPRRRPTRCPAPSRALAACAPVSHVSHLCSRVPHSTGARREPGASACAGAPPGARTSGVLGSLPHSMHVKPSGCAAPQRQNARVLEPPGRALAGALALAQVALAVRKHAAAVVAHARALVLVAQHPARAAAAWAPPSMRCKAQRARPAPRATRRPARCPQLVAQGKLSKLEGTRKSRA